MSEQPPKPTVEERFLANLDLTGDGCWEWMAYRTPAGYGRFMDGGKALRAHRWAYLNLIGPIPNGKVLDHLCRNRGCVNPAHLEPVTDRVNVMRGETIAARNAAKMHCINGHPLSGNNLYVHPTKGFRYCRQCDRDRHRRHREENRV